jgi:hypothetical protein
MFPASSVEESCARALYVEIVGHQDCLGCITLTQTLPLEGEGHYRIWPTALAKLLSGSGSRLERK